MTVRPRHPAPSLVVDTLDGKGFDLSKVNPERYTFLVFYRGLHCGFCRRYLQSLQESIDEFTKRGVEVLSLSCDPKERAEQSVKDWELDRLNIGYGVTLEKADEWDLYISTGIVEDQPDYFAEPGLFLINPDGTVYGSYIQNLPWARPRVEDILFMLDFLSTHDKPPRGEVELADIKPELRKVS